MNAQWEVYSCEAEGDDREGWTCGELTPTGMTITLPDDEPCAALIRHTLFSEDSHLCYQIDPSTLQITDRTQGGKPWLRLIRLSP